MPSQVDINKALLAVDHITSLNRRYALYGAGTFGTALLNAILHGKLAPPAMIIDDAPGTHSLRGIAVSPLNAVRRNSFDHILLATDTAQALMKEQINLLFPDIDPVDLQDFDAQFDTPVCAGGNIPDNIFHCCAHKTASQWLFKKILGDFRTQTYSRLPLYHYETALFGRLDDRPIYDRHFSTPFPTGAVVGPMFLDFPCFAGIPKPDRYRAFYVQRDPRDLIVSLYFSMLHSHPLMGDIPQIRMKLSQVSRSEGIGAMIRQWDETGYYRCLRSWMDAPEQDPNVMLLRYEDMVGDSQAVTFKTLFRHCGIPLPAGDLYRLLDEHSFTNLTGRRAGQDNAHSHLRKGIAGDWRNHFDDTNLNLFYSLTGDLTDIMGYVR